eukprot:CAMPEP_0119305988 /NCGR_PEP_ID=MMETSP1333-20130426/6845_1 /TAXON_ID=418940 /ORGANISM="Scyphosphaera apsteinii, Strain RCC1455" /LENGTH=229 /DNA_ID=CAMNT_0007309187 /DNA_START=472 /DNA_END=1161 /DNA_ORIENTATION=-
MALPQTAAIALCAPIALPAGLEGHMWHESFESDGQLIRASAGERRRLSSLQQEARTSLQALLKLLERAGWPAHRVFLLGFAQGAAAALDFALHCGCRLGGIISVCGLLLEEYLHEEEAVALLAQSAAAPRRETPLLVLESVLTPQRQALFELYQRALCGGRAVPPKSTRLCKAIEIGGTGAMPSSPEEWQPVMAFFAEHLELTAPGLESDPTLQRIIAVGKAGELVLGA